MGQYGSGREILRPAFQEMQLEPLRCAGARVGQAVLAQPVVTYVSFSAIFPSRTVKMSTPRALPRPPSGGVHCNDQRQTAATGSR